MLPRCLALSAIACLCARAELTLFPDFVRVTPAGTLVESDRPASIAGSPRVQLPAARGGYVSFQVVAAPRRAGAYRLSVQPFAAGTGLTVEPYREWFHWLPAIKAHVPDALIPAALPYSGSMPEPDNKISGQTAQAFWIDVWVPREATPGTYKTVAGLTAAEEKSQVEIEIRVLRDQVPADDVIAVDHNSYGTSWFAEQYPELMKRSGPGFFASPAFYDLIHAYHRVFYEHRGVFHQLGYGHAGKVGPEFAPALAGSGKTKQIADWTEYDRHYGPLLDGSAFRDTHRGPRPIPFVYLPINPEWPASFLWWGEPGYEREFTTVVSEMERHFREMGWTKTRFELFFNHKKRYKGFAWDGDETRFVRDYEYLKTYGRMMKAAVPADSPVKFVYRADASWTMEREFRELAKVINFWVCGAGMFSWYPQAPAMLKQRGDIVWIYGGTPPVTEPLSHMTTDLLRTWMFGVDGFVRWQTTASGSDPWFRFEGGSEALVYPGDRFGIGGPIPSIRLKYERNALQDLALLDARRQKDVRNGVAKAFNNTSPGEWWNARPALADTNPEDWSNADIDDAIPHRPKFVNVDAGAWERVRNYLSKTLEEAR